MPIVLHYTYKNKLSKVSLYISWWVPGKHSCQHSSVQEVCEEPGPRQEQQQGLGHDQSTCQRNLPVKYSKLVVLLPSGWQRAEKLFLYFSQALLLPSQPWQHRVCHLTNILFLTSFCQPHHDTGKPWQCPSCLQVRTAKPIPFLSWERHQQQQPGRQSSIAPHSDHHQGCIFSNAGWKP